MRPNWRSSGVATADAIVSGLAPGRLAWTWRVGKPTWGRGATGSRVKARTPAMASAAVRREVAKGRLINGAERFTKTPRGPVLPPSRESVRALAHGGLSAAQAGQRRGKQPESCIRSKPG